MLMSHLIIGSNGEVTGFINRCQRSIGRTASACPPGFESCLCHFAGDMFLPKHCEGFFR